MKLGAIHAASVSETSALGVLVAHAGKQHAYRHAASLQQLGLLRAFVTSSYYKPDAFPDRLFGRWSRLDRCLRRRHYEALDSTRILRSWSFELPELLARAAIGGGRLSESLMFHRDAAFDRWVARNWAGTQRLYWGFQGSCLESLRAARRAGSIAVAEFATAHVTAAIKLLSAEQEKHPEWADSISNLHFPDWYRHRLEREPHEADYCIAASDFTRRTLLDAGIADERIKILPLGVDLDSFTFVERKTDGPFRILFVGGVGQRKGIKYLLDAYKRMRSASTELVIAGPIQGSGKALASYQGLYEYVGRLDQGAVRRLMQSCHVLVLPSVFEGFGLVIPEAMATGMPVVASTHSIGPEIIRDGQDGFVLQPDDVEGLATKLTWLAEQRREASEMGRHAATRATQFSWDVHASRLGLLIDQIMNELPTGNGRNDQSIRCNH